MHGKASKKKVPDNFVRYVLKRTAPLHLLEDKVIGNPAITTSGLAGKWGSLRPFRILVVDDHPHYLRIVSAWLANLPGIAHVASATSGVEAPGLFEFAAPDLVLTDIHMPEMNGSELSRSIKSRRNGAVIVITTLTGSPELHAAAITNGADHFIVKTDLFRELPKILTHRFGHSTAST